MYLEFRLEMSSRLFMGLTETGVQGLFIAMIGANAPILSALMESVTSKHDILLCKN